MAEEQRQLALEEEVERMLSLPSDMKRKRSNASETMAKTVKVTHSVDEGGNDADDDEDDELFV